MNFRGGLVLFALFISLAACAPHPVVVESDVEEAPMLADFELAEVEADSLLEEEALPQDESLLTKILRSHPELSAIDELYREGGELYFLGDLDPAEENFYILKERITIAREGNPDSLAILYLNSMDRKVDNFAAILAEERFFSDSYAARDLSLEETFLGLREAYGIPDFILPTAEESKTQFERELLLVEHERVDKWMRAFTGRLRGDFGTWLERKARIGHVIERILEEEGLPRELIQLSMIESGLSAGARSRAAAVGYWQFIRGTARNRGLRVDEWVDERRDLELSTRAASRHLKLLFGMFGNWPLALAAYNAGEYRIQRAIGLQDDVDYWELRLPRETRDYVPKFIAAARIASDPARYGFEVASVDTLRYDSVVLEDAYSLDQLARAGELSERQLRELNPQLLAGCTPPRSDEYTIRVPAGSGERLAAAASEIPEGERLNWRRHKLRSGETIGALARRYRTSSSAIMELNGIRDPRRVRAGRVLVIPYPRGVAPPAQVAAASESSPRAGSNARQYVVRKGDTLDAIARAHGISVSSIRSANGIRGSRIQIGQRLRLPVRGAAGQDADESTHERTYYKVRRGDTLVEIGRRFQVEVTDLLRWNDLPSDGRIRAGETLKIWRPRS